MAGSTLQLFKDNRSGLLFVTLVLFLVVHPFTAEGGLGNILFGVLGTIVILSSVYAASHDHRHLMAVVLLAIVAIAGTWIAQARGTDGAWIFSNSATALLHSYLAVILLRYVLQAGDRVTADRLFAGVCIYFFLGLIFARAYHVIELTTPGSFAGISEDTAMATDDLTYFSFVTLTTLGYGDITPKTPQARCFAILEACAGVLYLAVLISRLASQYRRQDTLTE